MRMKWAILFMHDEIDLRETMLMILSVLSFFCQKIDYTVNFCFSLVMKMSLKMYIEAFCMTYRG